MELCSQREYHPQPYSFNQLVVVGAKQEMSMAIFLGLDLPIQHLILELHHPS